jgi:flagellar assembly protein FliH
MPETSPLWEAHATEPEAFEWSSPRTTEPAPLWTRKGPSAPRPLFVQEAESRAPRAKESAAPLSPLELPEVKAAIEDAVRAAQQEAEQLHQKATEEAQRKLRDALTQLQNTRRRVAPDPREVIELALAVARELLRHELQAKPERLQEAIREVLRAVEGENEVTVRLSPQDLAWAREHLDASHEAGLTFVADPSLSPGDCVAETKARAASLTVEARIDAVRERVLAALAEEVAP